MGFHDVKTEANTGSKELFDKQCPLVQYRKSGNAYMKYFILI